MHTYCWLAYSGKSCQRTEVCYWFCMYCVCTLQLEHGSAHPSANHRALGDGSDGEGGGGGVQRGGPSFTAEQASRCLQILTGCQC